MTLLTVLQFQQTCALRRAGVRAGAPPLVQVSLGPRCMSGIVAYVGLSRVEDGGMCGDGYGDGGVREGRGGGKAVGWLASCFSFSLIFEERSCSGIYSI
jgi:hypothetical protein